MLPRFKAKQGGNDTKVKGAITPVILSRLLK